MKDILIHKANTRGHADHGWLDSHHTFSFAGYYDPSRMNFGVLRVLNDDVVEGGMGFGKHPHDNMEIISIPLHGDLEHHDSMGNKTVIRQGDVQIMSAGTGISHSEYNHNKNEKVNFLQIWILPKNRNTKPGYDQKTFLTEDRKNKFQQIVSPEYDPDGITINQDAWFSMGNFSSGFETNYNRKKAGNGVYVFILEGEITVNGNILNKRDGAGITGDGIILFKAKTDSEILVMEVPMTLIDQ